MASKNISENATQYELFRKDMLSLAQLFALSFTAKSSRIDFLSRDCGRKQHDFAYYILDCFAVDGQSSLICRNLRIAQTVQLCGIFLFEKVLVLQYF